MTDVSFAAAVVAWGVLPGLLLTGALGSRSRWVERLSASPGLSLALVAGSAYMAEAAGLPVAPVPVAGVIAAVTIVLWRVRVALGTSPPTPGPPASDEIFVEPPTAVAWLVLLLPLVVVGQLEPATRFLLLPPSMHDGLDHANYFRLIVELRSLDPAVLLAPPLNPDGSPGYYPLGMHAVLALVAQSASLEPTVALMRSLVLISAALPLSVYAFASTVMGRSWPALAAGAASLVFWWLPYQVWGWGGYPLLAGAVAALPVAALSASAAREARLAGLAAGAFAGIGLLVIHPSQAFAALIVAATLALTWAAARLASWRASAPFVLGLALAGLALTAGASAWLPLEAFLDKAADVGAKLSSDPRYAWPAGAYFGARSPLSAPVRTSLGLLAVVGAVVALGRRALWPLVTLHAAGSLLVAGAPYQTWWTSLWYHAPERIWYLQYASLPALAGIGVAAILAPVERLARRWIVFPWKIVLWPAALSIVTVTLHQPFTAAAERQLFLYTQRNPNFTFTDRRVLSDFAWVRANVPAGSVLFNAPADWGLPLPFTGLRTVFWSGGYAIDPSVNWNQMLAMLRAGEPHASQAAAEIDRLGIRYVYAARLDPALEVGGRLPLSGEALEGIAGLERLYQSPTATIFRVRDEPTEWFGVRDSDRITFENFDRVQGTPGREWRWTDVGGTLRIRPAATAGSCHVRLFGPPIDTYIVVVDGRAVPPTPRGFPIPEGSLTGEPVDLEVRTVDTPSSGLAPDQPQPIGVRLTDVALRCAGS